MAISANPMDAQDRQVRIALAKASLDQQRLRHVIVTQGTAQNIERMAKLDIAEQRLVRMAKNQLDRTRDRREQQKISADERASQPKPALTPSFDKGNNRAAVGMSRFEKAASIQRAAQNVRIEDGQETRRVQEAVAALKTAKLNRLADAVQESARTRSGSVTDRQKRVEDKSRFNAVSRQQDSRERE